MIFFFIFKTPNFVMYLHNSELILHKKILVKFYEEGRHNAFREVRFRENVFDDDISMHLGGIFEWNNFLMDNIWDSQIRLNLWSLCISEILKVKNSTALITADQLKIGLRNKRKSIHIMKVTFEPWTSPMLCVEGLWYMNCYFKLRI